MTTTVNRCRQCGSMAVRKGRLYCSRSCMGTARTARNARAFPAPAADRKTCRTCQEEKPITRFYIASGYSRDGRVHECKVCFVERSKRNQKRRQEEARL